MNFLPVSAFPAGTGMYRAETIGFRPEHSEFIATSSFQSESAVHGGDDAIIMGTGPIKLIEPLGAVTLVHCELAPGLEVVSHYYGSNVPDLGAEGFLKIDVRQLHFFDGEDRRVSK